MLLDSITDAIRTYAVERFRAALPACEVDARTIDAKVGRLVYLWVKVPGRGTWAAEIDPARPRGADRSKMPPTYDERLQMLRDDVDWLLGRLEGDLSTAQGTGPA